MTGGGPGWVKGACHCGARWAIKEEAPIPSSCSGVWHSLGTSINRRIPITRTVWRSARTWEKKKGSLWLSRDWREYRRHSGKPGALQDFWGQQRRYAMPPTLPSRQSIAPSTSALSPAYGRDWENTSFTRNATRGAP